MDCSDLLRADIVADMLLYVADIVALWNDESKGMNKI